MKRSEERKTKNERRGWLAKHGFTLIEVLVVLTVFGIVFVVANQILLSTLRGSAKSEATVKVKREGERVVAIMERELHNATSIACAGNTSVTFTSISRTSTVESFSCSAGQVLAGSSPLTSDQVQVTSCSIQCQTTGQTRVVDINLTISERSGIASPRPEERSTVTFKTKVLLRN